MDKLGKDQFVDLLEPLIVQLGYELVDIDALFGSRSSVLRLYIDKDDGITLKDCEKVSRQVGALLDVEDPISADYSLEVSSPGLNRRLIKAEHFQRFSGEKVKIKLHIPFEDRRNFKSKLLGFKDDKVLVDDDGITYAIPMNVIDSARLIPEL
ncbi:MAG: ribosome maturation factor RimP [Pseudomonadota bacterium]|nr:ribosome maturation factor RimP [Pseudomonadota bacterium]